MSAIFYKDGLFNGNFELSSDSSKSLNFGHREALNLVIDNVTALPVGAIKIQAGQIIYKSNGGAADDGFYVATSNKTSGVLTSDWKRVSFQADGLQAHASTHKKLGSDAIRLDELDLPTASVDLNSQKIVGLSDPAGDQDAATKAYVDSARSGLNIKDPVRVATTALLTCASYASGTLTASANAAISIDGISLVLGDRVLVKNNVTVTSPLATNSAIYNGIYEVTQVGSGSLPWKLKRTKDFDGTNTYDTINGITTNGEVKTGAATWVNEGTANPSSRWALTTLGTITIDTSSLTFVKDFQAKDLNATAASGINYTAPDISVKAGHGISVDTTGVNVKPNPTTPTISVDTNGVKVNFNTAQFQATANGLELKPMMKSYCKKVELTSVNMANSKISGSTNNVIAHGLQCDSGTSTVDVTPTTVDFYDKKGNQVFFEVITLSTTQVTFTSTTDITLGVAGTATNIFMVTSYVG